MSELEQSEERSLNRSINLNLWFCGMNTANWSMSLGSPLILLVTLWGGSTFQVGVLVSSLFLFMPLQIWANVLLGRVGCKQLMVSGWSMRNLFLLPLPLIITFYGMEPAQWKVYVAIAGIGLFSLTRSIAVTAHLPWMYGLIPDALRSRFFSNFTIVMNLTGAGMFLLSGIAFSLIDEGTALNIIFWLALISGFLAARILSQLPDVPKPDAYSLEEINQKALHYLKTPSTFRRAVAIWALVAAFADPLNPFLIYYVSQERILSADYVMLMALLGFTGGLVGSMLARAWLDYLGTRLFALLALFGIALSMLVLLVIIGYFYWTGHRFSGMEWAILMNMFLAGMFKSIWYTTGLKMQPYFTQEGTRALQISIFQSMSPFAVGIASLLWGALLSQTTEAGYRISAPGLMVFLCLSVLVLMISSYFIARIPLREAISRPINFFAKLLHK